MNASMQIIAVAGLLGAGLVGGIFYAFSSFIMTALGRLPVTSGVGAMQSINVVVLNPSFLGLFLGTAAVSVVAAAVAVAQWHAPATPFLLAGALLYGVGTFLVTVRGNVPLNERLAGLAATDPEAGTLWRDYLRRWTRLNTIRTAAAGGAALMYGLALIGSAPA